MYKKFKYVIKILFFDYLLRFFLKKTSYKLYSINKINTSRRSKITKKTKVHMIWLYGKLSQIETMCINSFLINGFEVNLWTLDKIFNIPKNTKVRNLNKFYKKIVYSSYTGDPGYILMSDILRVKILYKYGGLYSDTDVICFIKEKKFSKIFDEPFLCSEMNHKISSGICVNNNLLYFPKPRHYFLDFVNNFTMNYPPKKNIPWALIAGKFFDLLAKNIPDFVPKIMSPEFANPIPYWKCPDIFLHAKVKFPKGMAFLHLYNERWRVSGFRNCNKYQQGSIINSLLDKYNHN
jgi:hypothetical protein